MFRFAVKGFFIPFAAGVFLLCFGFGVAAASIEGTIPEEAGLAPGKDGGWWVSVNWLSELLEDEILHMQGWDPDKVEFHSCMVTPDRPLEEKPHSYDIVPPGRVHPGQRVRMRVIFYGEKGRLLRRSWVSARVELYQNVWVLNRTFSEGEILTPSDLVSERRQSRRLSHQIVDDPDEIIGMSAKRRLMAGSDLRRDQWEGRSVIERGQTVKILFDSKAIRLVAPGQSLESAGQGDMVRVMNLESRKVITARVLNGQTVKVDF